MTQWGLDTLFNPAKRHMDEEKRRLQSTREEVGDNSGGKRIDLESGKVVIRRDDADDTDEDPDAPESSKSADGRSGSGKDGKAGKEPSAAQLRAAKRRGRTLN